MLDRQHDKDYKRELTVVLASTLVVELVVSMVAIALMIRGDVTGATLSLVSVVAGLVTLLTVLSLVGALLSDRQAKEG